MAFDGLMTYTIVKELQNTIIGGKVDKIFEPNENEMILGIYHHNTSYALNMVTTSQHYRICFTTHAKPNPNFAPNFCMVLRKYLLNTRITKIETLGLERLVIIEFEGHNKSGDFSPKKLIVELMGKHSNIILVDSNNRIIDALKHFDTASHSYRDILPNHLYTFPISHKLNFFDMKDETMFFDAMIEHPAISDDRIMPLSKIVSDTFTGISQASLLFFCQELKIEDSFHANNCAILYQYINQLLSGEQNLALVFENQDYYLTFASSHQDPCHIAFALDDYYFQKEYDENFTTYRSNLSRLILQHVKRLTNKLNTIEARLKECQNTDTYQLYGELITNNLYRVDSCHQDTIELENYYDNNKKIQIPLDKSITPAENAKRYFKKYHKLKNAKQIVESQKLEVEQEIHYLESVIYELQIAKTVEEIDDIYHEFSENFTSSASVKQGKKKKLAKSSKQNKRKIAHIGDPIKTSIDGFTILIGKNNRQNDDITKHASPEDIWFHAKDVHGSHVILKTENKIPSQETINAVAAITAFYSKAGASSNVSVDYTNVKYVKKPSNAKPGMVIYTNYKNVTVKPKKI